MRLIVVGSLTENGHADEASTTVTIQVNVKYLHDLVFQEQMDDY